MFKMDTHTKQVFLSGVFVYISTVSGLVFKDVVLSENHTVRIEVLEKTDIQTGVELKRLAAEQVALGKASATQEVLLQTIKEAVVQLNATAQTLLIVTTELKAQRAAEKNND